MKSPLPVVEGIAPSCKWLPAGPWPTVLDFLIEQYPNISSEAWQRRMRSGKVVDGNGERLQPGSRYRTGTHVFYYRELQAEKKIPFAEQVIYEDEHLLVVDKPHFLPVIPAGRFVQETLLTRLKRPGNREQLVPIHRLDRETAGIVVFSVNERTRGDYASLFQQRKVAKVYEALAPVKGGMDLPLSRRSRIVRGKPFFRMCEVGGVANAETVIDLVHEVPGGIGLYRLRSVTGRKHQIRVHLSALGISVVNDKLYPTLRLTEDDDYTRPLQLLARSLAFQDPLTGTEHFFEGSRKLNYDV